MEVNQMKNHKNKYNNRMKMIKKKVNIVNFQMILIKKNKKIILIHKMIMFNKIMKKKIKI